MSSTKQRLRAAADFFAEHAGYSYRPERETPEEGRRRTGRLLALSEAKARRDGLVFSWEPEPYPDLSWMDEDEAREEHEVECCIVYRLCECCGQVDEGGPLASLGNIVDASAEYRRVVEAELASEVFATSPL